MATLFAAVSLGDLERVKYLYEGGVQGDTSYIASAAEHGHLKVVKYLYEAGARWTNGP